MLMNINPLWESHQTTDADVVKYYEGVIPPDSPHFVTPDDMGKPELNSKLASWERQENRLIMKEDLMSEGMDAEAADKEAIIYADELYANTLMALNDLYEARKTS